MKIKLGFAVSNTTPNSSDLLEKIKQVRKLGLDAIELSLTREEKFKQEFTEEIIKALKEFEYRSIHAPVLDTNWKPIKYPSKIASSLLGVIDKLIQQINPHVVLFHPDIVIDFEWLNKRYGHLLAFENMDKPKKFGRTMDEMKEVFSKSPQAKWIFDVNHLYTNDKTMRSAKTFYEAFKDRLTHYHISAYGGFHDCFCNTHEDVILEGVLSLDKPPFRKRESISGFALTS